MRIVGGRWAGRPLHSPGGRVRPTAETLRDAWMRLLEPELRDAFVLDLFAGTGALGLEALSRGARAVDFVENGASALHALKANVAALRLRERTRIFKKDALAFASHLEAGRYRVALADPPYGSGMLDRLIAIWYERRFSDILSVEHPPEHVVPPGGRSFRFDNSVLTVYR